MLGVAERCGFGIDGTSCLAHVGTTQNAKPLGVCRHKAILDSIVDHLYKMSGAVGTAVQIAMLGSATDRIAPRCSRRAGNAWRECRERRVKALHDVFFPANHHAVAAFKTPYTAARPYIHIVNFLWCELLSATNVVDVIRVAAVNEDVVGIEMRQEVGDILVHGSCRYHQPYRSGFRELFCEIRQ